ncbi:MBL fold metallo-hydrolase [Thermodesulfobacteriota bacterium]
MRFDEVDGILVILSEGHMWPNPANVFIIPDEKGFSLYDVGCGGKHGADHILKGLAHWNLHLNDLHTVVLSHSHPDHMGAMEWLLEEIQPEVFIHHLDIPSALEPAKLNETFDVPLVLNKIISSGVKGMPQEMDVLIFFEQSGCTMTAALQVEALHEDQVIQLGDFSFQVIHTPGHSPGHISLFDMNRGVVLSGDVVGKIPAWHTPASGGLIGYLNSLEKLELLNAKALLPSHGPIEYEPQKAIQRIRNSLLEKESFILELLEKEPKSFWQLVEAMYSNSFARAFPGCGMVESHLVKLENEGSIERAGDKISLVD